MTQTKQAKHTPIPWKYHLGQEAKPRFRIWSTGGYLIASTTELTTRHTAKLASDFDENEAREANAAFIVQAVNSHQELLGALQRLLIKPGHPDYYEGIEADATDEARNAITKAHAGGE